MTALEHLFQFFELDLADRFPAKAGGIVCPLCLQRFEGISNLSKAHLWPQKLGGRFFTLACKHCNSTIGTKVEKHEVERAKLKTSKKRAGRERIEGLEGYTSSLYSIIEVDGNPVILSEVQEKQSNPKSLALQKEMFKTNSMLGKSLNVFFKNRFSEQIARLTYLHFAYLALFQVAGYSWVFSPTAEVIRQQLKNPPAQIFPTFLLPFASDEFLENVEDKQSAILEILDPEDVRGYLIVTPELFHEDNHRKALWLPKSMELFVPFRESKETKVVCFKARFLTRVGREPLKFTFSEGCG